MAKCGDCLYFGFCKKYVDPEETFPEIDGGCHVFKNKDAFVEVVRCKDCKKRYTDDCLMLYSYYSDDPDADPEGVSVEWTVDNGFCPDGERRTDNA